MDVFSRATEQTAELAANVAAWEIHCAQAFARPGVDQQQLQQAIRATWPQVINDARSGQVAPSAAYVSALYARLSTAMKIADPGEFTDRTDIPWAEFYAAGCGDESRCEEAWVIAELYWGGYVKYFPLTLGWLLMNTIRLQHNLPAITPAMESTEHFTEYLRWAGPDAFDAESLRGLFCEFEKQTSG